MFQIVLAGDRITFTPTSNGRYKLTVPSAYDRILATVVPELAGLQDLGTSPGGLSMLDVSRRRVGGPLRRVA